MKILLLLSLFAINVFAISKVAKMSKISKLEVKTPGERWWCPPRSKFSKIGGDEPFCKIGYKLVQVEGRNLPEGYGCFACQGGVIALPSQATE